MIVQAACGTPVQIDEEDLEVFKAYPWKANKHGPNHRYLSCRSEGKTMYFHRLIMGAVKGEDVDHENGDGTDCRKSNLRRCSHQQNLCNRKLQSNNTSGYMGVFWGSNKKWIAAVKRHGKSHHIGCFDNKEDAARARDRAMAKINGVEFSTFNFPDEVMQ